MGGTGLPSTVAPGTSLPQPPATIGPTTSTGPVVDTGDVSGFGVVEVVVEGQVVWVAVADDAVRRSRGLCGVQSLGDLAGMLFTWGGVDVEARFTMADTLIPLDIAFLDADGVVLGVVEMQPCPGAPCPTYGIDVPFRMALESPMGSLGPAVGDVVVVEGAQP